MSAAKTPETIQALMTEEAVGKGVHVLQVLGINSLKSLQPAVDALVAQTVRACDVSGAIIRLFFDQAMLTIDLQRVGEVESHAFADVWSPASGTPSPTGRLIFEGGSAIDFKEPSRTKRITFTVGSV